jgi:hypothetical protein
VKAGSFVTLIVVVAGAVWAGDVFSTRLSDARAEAKAARGIANAAIARSVIAEDAAANYAARARAAEVSRDSALKKAEAASDDRDAAVDALYALQVPDTCADIFETARAAITSGMNVEEYLRASLQMEQIAHTQTKLALETTRSALVELRGSASGLSRATERLETAARPSFLARLLPRPGVGGAVGVDPQTGRFSKTAGITLSYTF